MLKKKKNLVVNLLVVVIAAFFVVGCMPKVKTVEGLKQDMADEYASGKYDDKLIGTVSFDTGCPKDKIKVTYRSDQAGSGMYKLDACGKEVRYKRTGTVFHDANKSPY